MPLRHLHRRTRNRAAEDELFGQNSCISLPDVQTFHQNGQRGAGRELRGEDLLERRPQHWYLLVRSSPQDLPVPRLQTDLATGRPIATLVPQSDRLII